MLYMELICIHKHISIVRDISLYIQKRGSSHSSPGFSTYSS